MVTNEMVEAATEAAFNADGSPNRMYGPWSNVANTEFGNRWRAAIRLALEAAEREAWKDIADAPRDGTEVLAICATAYSPTAAIAWWHDARWKAYSRPEDKWHGGVNAWFPTHFRLLPTPPAPEEPS